MLFSGLSIEEGLSITIEQSRGTLRRILIDVRNAVEGGIKLSTALGQYPKIFASYFLNIIKIGEDSGNLAENLNQISEQLFKEIKIRKNVQAAMVYPAIIFILPRVLNLFETIDVELPLVTRILISVAQFSADYAPHILVGVFAVLILAQILWRLDPIKYATQSVLLVLPVVKTVIRNANLAKFSRALNSLIAAGIPLAQSLASIGDATGNLVYRRSVKKILKEVEKGMEIAEVMSTEERLFPKMTYRLIRVGESTGKLEEVLKNLAEFYENEVDLATKNLTILIEPLLLIIVAAVVGTLGIAIVLPIYMFITSVGSL
jgi:type IV pilus assembly protein PilC